MTQPNLPLFDLQSESGRNALTAQIERLRPPVGLGSEAARTVSDIIEDVRQHRDDAVVKYMRKWTDPAFSRERMRVSEAELDAAVRSLSPELQKALEGAIANVRAYQTHLLPKDPEPIVHGGAEMGLRFTPVE